MLQHVQQTEMMSRHKRPRRSDVRPDMWAELQQRRVRPPWSVPCGPSTAAAGGCVSSRAVEGLCAALVAWLQRKPGQRAVYLCCREVLPLPCVNLRHPGNRGKPRRISRTDGKSSRVSVGTRHCPDLCVFNELYTLCVSFFRPVPLRCSFKSTKLCLFRGLEPDQRPYLPFVVRWRPRMLKSRFAQKQSRLGTAAPSP